MKKKLGPKKINKSFKKNIKNHTLVVLEHMTSHSIKSGLTTKASYIG